MNNAELELPASSQTIEFNGLLFDMDGTIIDSGAAIKKHWEKIGREIGVDPEAILATSHGRRSIDVLQVYVPELANWEYVNRAEGLIPSDFGQDAMELPGARSILENLERQNVPWAIVTSGTKALVNGWLDIMNLAHPKNMVTAEDVQNGKPDPACYKMGSQKLNLQAESPSFIVFEDAPAGIRSGKAAGFQVIALHTSHSLEELVSAGADYVVQDLTSVTLASWDSTIGKGQLLIVNPLT